MAAAVGVCEDLGSLLLLAGLTQPLGCFDRFTRIEDVQVPAPTAEGDHLSSEGADHVDVVRLQIAQYQWQGAETCKTCRGAAGAHSGRDLLSGRAR